MIVLVLGGARSGKSAVAESLAAQLPSPVTYVATLQPDPTDADLTARVVAHRERRPASWATVEAGDDLPAQLRRLSGTVLLDSLGAWVAADACGPEHFSALAETLASRTGDAVVVSDEVGLSVHPSTEAGRRFRDALGLANAAVAAVADSVLLVVAGRVVTTEPFDAARILRRER